MGGDILLLSLKLLRGEIVLPSAPVGKQHDGPSHRLKNAIHFFYDSTFQGDAAQCSCFCAADEFRTTAPHVSRGTDSLPRSSGCSCVGDIVRDGSEVTVRSRSAQGEIQVQVSEVTSESRQTRLSTPVRA